MDGAFFENGIHHFGVFDGLPPNLAIADKTFGSRLNSTVAVNFDHRGQYGGAPLLADLNQFLGQRTHL
jgi:hypothetical protein